MKTSKVSRRAVKGSSSSSSSWVMRMLCVLPWFSQLSPCAWDFLIPDPTSRVASSSVIPSSSVNSTKGSTSARNEIKKLVRNKKQDTNRKYRQIFEHLMWRRKYNNSGWATAFKIATMMDAFTRKKWIKILLSFISSNNRPS